MRFRRSTFLLMIWRQKHFVAMRLSESRFPLFGRGFDNLVATPSLAVKQEHLLTYFQLFQELPVLISLTKLILKLDISTSQLQERELRAGLLLNKTKMQLLAGIKIAIHLCVYSC